MVFLSPFINSSLSGERFSVSFVMDGFTMTYSIPFNITLNPVLKQFNKKDYRGEIVTVEVIKLKGELRKN